MSTGVVIICKKRLGQWLLMSKPDCIINGLGVRKLFWETNNFIELEPNTPYHFTIEIEYMWGTIGNATFYVNLKPGETQVYEYKTPFTVFDSGKITRHQ